MPTTKERILVTLTPSMAKELRARAKREKTPRATIARFLLAQAMDDLTDEEDKELSRIIDARAANPGTLLTSEEFWSRVEKKRLKK